MGCDLLKDGVLNVDYLGEHGIEYSIDPLQSDPIIKQYTDGSSLRQYQFAFTSLEWLDQGMAQNMDNSGFYEKFQDWIEAQNRIRNFPTLDNPIKTPQKIEAMTSGYLFDTTGENARYQIQCRLIYRQER